MILRTLHRYLALIIGLQVLIWTATGLAFNLIDDASLDGNRLRQPTATKSALIVPDIDINQILDKPSTPIRSVELNQLFGRPLYRINTPDAKLAIWGDSAEPVLLTQTELMTLAQRSYRGTGILSPAVLDMSAAEKFGASHALYRFDSQDEFDTQIFVDAHSGEVIAHYNRGAALKQLLFMLHFIDYNPNNGLSFNHFATQLLALMALILGVSGAGLVTKNLLAGHYFSRPTSQSDQSVTLLSPSGEHLEEIMIRHTNLLDSLNHQRQRLYSQCGGGGQCGMCRVRYIDNPPAATSEDLTRLKAKDVERGIRLSCQHKASKGTIALVNPAQLRLWHKIKTQQTQDQTKI